MAIYEAGFFLCCLMFGLILSSLKVKRSDLRWWLLLAMFSIASATAFFGGYYHYPEANSTCVTALEGK